jgi:hypothetical protein
MTQYYFPPPHKSPARGSSPPILEDPRDIDLYIQWFSVREPHNADNIEIVAAILNHEKDTLSTLEKMSKARVERHSLPAGLVDRMQGGYEALEEGKGSTGIAGRTVFVYIAYECSGCR